jgi:hypothetical protein
VVKEQVVENQSSHGRGQWSRVKQVVIVSEPALESRLLDLIERNGGKRLTVVSAQGRGLTGPGGPDVSGQLVRIECFCADDAAERVAQAIAAKFFAKYDVFVACAAVDVLRPEKF